MEKNSVPEMECSIKRRLANEVEKAIERTSEAHRAAMEEKGKRDISMILLVEARKNEMQAVKALNDHRKEHRC